MSKFYINVDTAFYDPPTWRGGWEVTGWKGILDTEPYGDATVWPYFQHGAVLSSPVKTGLVQAVSRVLQPQTISGTVNLIVSSNARVTNNAFTRLHIWVVNATTGALFATLLNQFEDVTGTEWFEGVSASSHVGVALSAPQTLTPCTIPNDSNQYRLVVEYGVKGNPTVGTLYQVQTVIGTLARGTFALMPDLTAGGDGMNGAGTITFSHDFLMVPIPIESNRLVINSINLGSMPVNATYNTLTQLKSWYKISFSKDATLSLVACNTTPRKIYMEVYRGDLTSLVYNIGSNYKESLIIPVKTGETLWLRVSTIQSFTGDPINFDFIEAPQGPVQVGDLLVLSDESSSNYYDPTMPGRGHTTWFNTGDGSIRYCTYKFIASELGVSLGDGKLGIADQVNNKLFVYDKAPALTELRRIDLGDFEPCLLGTDFVSFYVVDTGASDYGNKCTVKKISESGTIDARVWTLPYNIIGYVSGGGDASVGVTRDGKILYYGRSQNVNVPYVAQCCRHSLETDTEILPAFPPPSGGPYSHAGEVIVLKDNSIVCLFLNHTTGGIPKHKLVHYSPTGVILREVGYDSPLNLHHICHNSAYDMKVWLFHNVNDGNRFQLLNLENGIVERDFTSLYHDEGPLPGTCIQPARFDCAGSCPLMIMMQPFSLDLSGLYFMNPNKPGVGTVPGRIGRHDSYNGDIELKIPDPTFRLGLFGE